MSRNATGYSHPDDTPHGDQKRDEAPTTRAQAALKENMDLRRALMGDPEEFEGTQFSETGRRYAKRMRDKYHNRDFSEFAKRCYEGEEIPDQDMLRFLADPRRIGVENMAAISAYAGAKDLTSPEKSEFYRAPDAGITTISVRAEKADTPEKHRGPVERKALGAAIKYCLDANENDSVPMLEHSDPAVESSFNQLMQCSREVQEERKGSRLRRFPQIPTGAVLSASVSTRDYVAVRSAIPLRDVHPVP